jgi:hypothetical protein
MTLALPTLDPAVPVRLRSGVTDGGHAALAYILANGGHMVPADLRVGTGGLRRMVEKVFERWWREAGLPEWIVSPLQFHIHTDFHKSGARWPDGSRPQDGEPWLVLSAWRQARRYYLEHKFGRYHDVAPEKASHALAVAYRALDDFSYSLTPPRFLDFARRYWWNGAEDLAPGMRKKTGFLTRKMFETRFAACTLAPAEDFRWNVAATRANRGRPMNGYARHPLPEVRAVEDALLNPDRLTRNAFDLTEAPVCDFPIIVRWRWNDQNRRLGDHWFAELDGHANVDDNTAQEAADQRMHGGARPARAHRIARFTGAWPLRTLEELDYVRRRLPATVRLIHATDRLLAKLADSSAGGFNQ